MKRKLWKCFLTRKNEEYGKESLQGLFAFAERNGHMNEKTLMAMVSALDDYPGPPYSGLSQCEIENIIFSRWAVEESINLVWDHPWTLASDTIESFAVKLEAYVATAATEHQKQIFTIAAKSAWKLLADIKQVEK